MEAAKLLSPCRWLLAERQVGVIGKPYRRERKNEKKESLPFAVTWMDLEGIMLNERQILYDITYMRNLKNTTN